MPKRIATLMLIVDLPDDHKQHRITADLGEIGEAAKEQFEKDHPECEAVTMTCEPVRKTGPKTKATAADATKAADTGAANAAPAVEPAAELPVEPATAPVTAADAVRQATSGSRQKVAAE